MAAHFPGLLHQTHIHMTSHFPDLLHLTYISYMAAQFPGLLQLTHIQARKVSGHVCVLGLSRQESEQSCIGVLGVTSQEN
jgi:hypothetical protein